MHKLIISAPFGNYIAPQGTTQTLGTFTLAPRAGRVIQALRTIRYDRQTKAWTNRLGLRNPGISSAKDCCDCIVSIHGFTLDEWRQLLVSRAVQAAEAVELNVSCPNVDSIVPADVFRLAMASHRLVIVKLPPVAYQLTLDMALAAGVSWFHCCNTLPTEAGGLSGKPLLAIVPDVIRNIKRQADVTIIGGGGITSTADIDTYRFAGADYFSIGTGSLALWRLPKLARYANG